MASDKVVSVLMLPLWEEREVLWPFLGAWDSAPSTHNL